MAKSAIINVTIFTVMWHNDQKYHDGILQFIYRNVTKRPKWHDLVLGWSIMDKSIRQRHVSHNYMWWDGYNGQKRFQEVVAIISRWEKWPKKL